MASLMPAGKQQYFDNVGDPLVGGKLFTYEAGSVSTPLATFADAAGTTPNTNPVVLDARGEAVIFWNGSYKVRLEDSLGNLIWTEDNLRDPISAAFAYTDNLRTDLADATDAAKGAGLSGWGGTRNYAVGTIGWAPKQLEFSAKWFGVLDDGSDQSANIQAFLNLLAPTGGIAFFPKPTTRYQFGASISVPASVGIRGEGKWATIFRYTGTSFAFIPQNQNSSVMFADFTLQLSGNGATGFDYSQWISSTMRSVRIAQQGGATTLTGISANITNVAWTSYFNTFIDCTTDGLATHVFIDASVAQAANRWRFISHTFLSGANAFDIRRVQGIQIVSPVFNELTGFAISTGGAGKVSDRVTVSDAVFESNVGGTLFGIGVTTNRFRCTGYKIFAGVVGLATGIGTRGFVIGEWDDGIMWSGSATPTTTSSIFQDDNVGAKLTGMQSLSSTLVAGKNLCGTDTFAAAGSRTIIFPRPEADAAFRVFIMGRANENFWVTAPTINGFTANSSNAASTAQFDWFIVR